MDNKYCEFTLFWINKHVLLFIWPFPLRFGIWFGVKSMLDLTIYFDGLTNIFVTQLVFTKLSMQLVCFRTRNTKIKNPCLSTRDSQSRCKDMKINFNIDTVLSSSEYSSLGTQNSWLSQFQLKLRPRDDMVWTWKNHVSAHRRMNRGDNKESLLLNKTVTKKDKVESWNSNNNIVMLQKMLCIYPMLNETKFNQMKLPGRSTVINGLKSECPFSGRKGETFSPGLAQNNEFIWIHINEIKSMVFKDGIICFIFSFNSLLTCAFI